MDHAISNESTIDYQGPPEKKQKLDGYIEEVLVPVDPIKAVKFFLPGLVFKTSGYTHRSQVHTVSSTYREKIYKGIHPNRNQAKMKACSKIIDAFIKHTYSKDLSTSATELVGSCKGKLTLDNKGMDGNTYIVGQQTIVSYKKGKESLLYTFYQLNPSIKIDVYQESYSYIASVDIDGKEYRGEGSYRKSAKNRAVRAALSSFTAEDMDHLTKLREMKQRKGHQSAKRAEVVTLDDEEEQVNNGEGSSATKNRITDLATHYNDVEEILCDSNTTSSGVLPKKSSASALLEPTESSSKHSDDFGDFISRLVETSFKRVKDMDPSVPDCKVLAGIVMSRGDAINGSKVISLATGTRSIRGTNLSPVGEAMNDCHAEILVRRGLVSFLYDQIEKFGTNPVDSILKLVENHDQSSRLGLKVKEDVRFHLYSSSEPCGDASCSSYRQGGGALQTKREKRSGTIPIIGAQIQSWNGIMLGESLITMSCSDKMARWNVLGLQGSLLSHFLEPVYFQTVVIGNRFYSSSLKRSLIERVSNLQEIPAPFALTQPIFVPGTSSVITKDLNLDKNSTKLSVCWVIGWRNPEVIEAIKGKLNDGSSSRLCKRSFLQRFLSVVESQPNWNQMIEPLVKDEQISYLDLKKASRQFGEAKEMITASLAVTGFGKWVKKPMEQDTFTCPFGRTIKEEK